MTLGYDGKLYILAFDHRGSFQKKMFGIEGDPTPEQTATISDAKALIFEGLLEASHNGAAPDATGVLVDEQFGSDVPTRAQAAGLCLAMPVEKSGQDTFDFEYGDEFGAHIERFNPDFSKVLVRYNPEGDATANRDQLARLLELSDWLHAHERKFLFELLVPAEPAQLESVGGDTDRYDAELRPQLMRRTIEEIQNAGVEPDVWKIEGVDAREDCEMLIAQTRVGGRDGVVSVLLGRGADDAKVDHWLQQAAPVDGFVGFAIGRSIWWDALKGFLAGDLDRASAASQISSNYLRFIDVYEKAEGKAPRSMSPSRVQSQAAMRMRRSEAELERAFAEEAQRDRARRESLRQASIARAHQRRADREVKRSSLRFAVLSLTLIATAVIVTLAMFRALYVLLG